MWARTWWPLVSSTRKLALRRHSTTMPSSSMVPAFLGMVDQLQVAVRVASSETAEQRQGCFVGFVDLGRDGFDAGVVQVGQHLAEQCATDSLVSVIGQDCDRADPRLARVRRQSQEADVLAVV